LTTRNLSTFLLRRTVWCFLIRRWLSRRFEGMDWLTFLDGVGNWCWFD
jgi:hypothetical protein